MKKISHYLNFLFLLFLLYANFNTQAQTVVCRNQQIEGFTREYSVGQDVCGETTSEIAKASIYVTVQGKLIYFQSNFVTPSYEYPTKIATDQKASIETYLQNIFYSGSQSHYTVDEMISFAKKHVKIILDPALINDSNFGTLDFFEFKKLNIVTENNQISKAIKIVNSDGTHELLVEINTNISARIKGQNLAVVFSKLRERRFSGKKFKIISFVENSPTKKYLNEHFSNRKIDFKYSNKDDLKTLLLANKAHLIVVLGHIENGAFVVIDPSGKVLFKVTISELENWQKENNLKLLLLGCSSALNGAKHGTLDPINPIETLARLRTTERTESFGEFLDSLTFRTMHYVVDEAIFDENFEEGARDEAQQDHEFVKIKVYKKPHDYKISSSERSQLYFYGININDSSPSITTAEIDTSTQQQTASLTSTEPPSPVISTGNVKEETVPKKIPTTPVILVLITIVGLIMCFIYFKKDE